MDDNFHRQMTRMITCVVLHANRQIAKGGLRHFITVHMVHSPRHINYCYCCVRRRKTTFTLTNCCRRDLKVDLGYYVPTNLTLMAGQNLHSSELFFKSRVSNQQPTQGACSGFFPVILIVVNKKVGQEIHLRESKKQVPVLQKEAKLVSRFSPRGR